MSIVNLTSGRTALQALLGSLGDNNPSAGNLSAEQVRKLSDKILGDREDRDVAQGDEPDQIQLLNEEGLPVIDISEPVHEDTPSSPSPSLIPEPEIILSSLLPPDEKERRRRERDRILDLLEEEERLQQLQEEKDEEEERKEAIRKRKESAKAELEQLKAARELQKRMGRALVGHAKERKENRQEDALSNFHVASPVAGVSFADAPAGVDDTGKQQTSVRQPDWGDVTLGRLRAQDVTLVSAAEAQKYPMKMHVMERRHTAISPPFHRNGDSDDESASAGDLFPHTEDGSSYREDGSSSSDDLLDDEPLEEEFDYDAARHHREIALEYHEKRHVIGAGTTNALAAHDLDDCERHKASNGVPLSRFRADRMAAAYDESHGLVSTSIGPTVIPALRQKFLRNSVRLGKLENNQLAGGESGESGSEDETAREVIQMLKTGAIRNAGPNLKPPSMSAIASDAVGSTMAGTSSATAHGVKPSKFKLARGGITGIVTPQDTHSEDSAQPQRTVSNVVERKAPRSSPSPRFPVNKSSTRPSVKAPELALPMMVGTLSLPSPATST